MLGAVDALGASIVQAIQTLQDLVPTAGRGRIQQIKMEGKTITLIDDAYNANPASMQAGLESLSFYQKRKVVVLGDMLELGDEALQRHLDILTILAHNGVDKVFAVGTLMKSMFDQLPENQKGVWCQTAEEIASVLIPALRDQDVLYIKSSHGTGLYKLVNELKGM